MLKAGQLLYLDYPYIRAGNNYAQEDVALIPGVRRGFTRYECMGCHNLRDARW